MRDESPRSGRHAFWPSIYAGRFPIRDAIQFGAIPRIRADQPWKPGRLLLYCSAMSHAYSRNYVHLVFSTKERRAFLKATFRGEVHKYLAGICREYGVDVDCINGTDDHVHLLVLLPPKISVSVLIRALKANSSKWINEQRHLFAWQIGYGCFSVSVSSLESVREYVRNQEEHHKKRDFVREYNALLRKHGIVSSERVFQ